MFLNPQQWNETSSATTLFKASPTAILPAWLKQTTNCPSVDEGS